MSPILPVPYFAFERAGLLQSAKRYADGIEHIQQQEKHVLIHVQQAIVRAITLAGRAMQTLQQPANHLEVLEAFKVSLFHLVAFSSHHSR